MILLKNPIHSVLFLILVFFNSSILFLFNNAEFLAMILLIVYIGAVAVLFLFVIMMLDINITKLRLSFLNYLPLYTKKMNSNLNNQLFENTKLIGSILYTEYFLLFQLSGIILLIAMIGAIFLTLRKREGVKKQNIYNQILRK